MTELDLDVIREYERRCKAAPTFHVGQRVRGDVAYRCGEAIRPIYGTVVAIGECPEDGPFVRVDWDDYGAEDERASDLEPVGEGTSAAPPQSPERRPSKSSPWARERW